MQDRHKVRVCVGVVHLLADEVKNLGGTFGVYMHLEKSKTAARSLRAAQCRDWTRVRVCPLPIQSVSTEPARPRSAASQRSLNV